MRTELQVDVPGFDRPTSEPTDPDQREQWQKANRSWWEDHPMRYDWNEEVGFEVNSREFFAEIDRRFFQAASNFFPPASRPFEPLIDFAALATQDVLEIGVGAGSHAQLLASNARSFTGIDLTEAAVTSSTQRMKAFGIKAVVRQMDAEELDFPDESFDFIWSWGVIHHSANTSAILREMKRVLRPGGRATVMVYHRGLFNYYIVGLLFRGLLQGELFRTRSLNKTVQRGIDGAIARFYTRSEWRNMVEPDMEVESTEIYGARSELFPIPASRFKTSVMKMMPMPLSRFLLHRCRMGFYLVSDIRKPA